VEQKSKTSPGYWTATDGRRLAMFYSSKDVRSKEKPLRAFIEKWRKIIEKMVCPDTLSAASGLHGFLNYSRLPEAVPIFSSKSAFSTGSNPTITTLLSDNDL
jgi:hypothetical protein